jgi:hypothetical protein
VIEEHGAAEYDTAIPGVGLLEWRPEDGPHETEAVSVRYGARHTGATRRLHGGHTEAYQKIKIKQKKQKSKKEKRFWAQK